jgi:hypothetical protein
MGSGIADPKRASSIMRKLLFIAVVASLAGCNDESIVSATSTDDPYVRGPITQILPDGRLVVDDGTFTACGAAIVRVTASSAIVRRGGGQASHADLRPPRRVAVWPRGGILKSCPPQMEARLIELES